MYDFAWALGPRLVTLRLDGDVYWEADIGILASSLPNLEDLALPAITVPTKNSLDVLRAKVSRGTERGNFCFKSNRGSFKFHGRL